MILGIDASNIRAGGGVTYLSELLSAAQPALHSIERIIVWGGQQTVERLPQRPWLHLAHEPVLDGSLPQRVFWQQIRLTRLAEQYCDVLFVPGGTYIGRFRPFVTMSQNLFPFEPQERRRFGLSWSRVRLTLLETIQTLTFRRAAGVIFLTEAARQIVERRTGSLPGKVTIVPHGVAERFRRKPRTQKPLSAYSFSYPFRWLYVSLVDLYKHQWHVAEAVARLRLEGIPVALDLVGPALPRGLHRLQEVMRQVDPGGNFISYRGAVPYSELNGYYHRADGFAFASSCENMPNILLEAMAAGLPIASSNRGPMPEVLGDTGVYFDPEDAQSIAEALHRLIMDPVMREEYAWTAYERAQQYSWTRCAEETFSFLTNVAKSFVQV